MKRKQINPDIDQKKALLVVDVDSIDDWLFLPEEPERQQFAASLIKGLSRIRKDGVPIIFAMFDQRSPKKPALVSQLKHAEHCLGCSREENKLAEFLEHRHGAEFEPIFIKYRNNAFTNSELVPYLRLLYIKELLLAGCNTFNCILETAEGAVRAGFNVTLLENLTYPPFDNVNKRGDSKEKWLTIVRSYIKPNNKVKVSIDQMQ